jgi:hypothetical protein
MINNNSKILFDYVNILRLNEGFASWVEYIGMYL